MPLFKQTVAALQDHAAPLISPCCRNCHALSNRIIIGLKSLISVGPVIQ